MPKRKFDSRTLGRPVEIAIHLPPGDFDGVVGVLATRAAKLAGFAEGPVKELSRALIDVVGHVSRNAGVKLKFVWSKPSFTIALQSGNGKSGAQLLEAWERKKAHRLMDDARLIGEGDARELLLVKTLA